MVLESSEPKENDKILKKNFFRNFEGFRAPPQNSPKPKNGGFKGAETPQNIEKNNFKILLFSLGSELSRTIFIFDFQFQEVFFKGGHWT